jgi:hypothetical protein
MVRTRSNASQQIQVQQVQQQIQVHHQQEQQAQQNEYLGMVKVEIGRIMRSSGAGRFLLSHICSSANKSEEMPLDPAFRQALIGTISLFNPEMGLRSSFLNLTYPFEFICSLKLKLKRLKQRVREAVERFLSLMRLQHLNHEDVSAFV